MPPRVTTPPMDDGRAIVDVQRLAEVPKCTIQINLKSIQFNILAMLEQWSTGRFISEYIKHGNKGWSHECGTANCISPYHGAIEKLGPNVQRHECHQVAGLRFIEDEKNRLRSEGATEHLVIQARCKHNEGLAQPCLMLARWQTADHGAERKSFDTRDSLDEILEKVVQILKLKRKAVVSADDNIASMRVP